MPLVSVIVPVYNAENHLTKTVESVLAQTHDNFELILVNDGSVDSSPEICKYFSEIDHRVRAFHQDNRGPGAARNRGIMEAKGQYLAFVDADDTVAEDWLERMVTLQMASNADLVCTGYNKLVVRDGIIRKIKSFKPRAQLFQSKEEIRMNIGSILHSRFLNPLWNKLYSRRFVLEHGLFIEESFPLGEDFLFNLEYLVRCNSVHFSDIACYNHVINQDSLTHQFRKDKYELLDKVDNRKREILSNNGYDSNLVDSSSIRIIYSCFMDLFHRQNNMRYKEKLAYINRILNLSKTQSILRRYYTRNYVEDFQLKVLKTNSPNVILLASFFFWLLKYKFLKELN